jgi:RimJ/RimL family protein N-acetyltransferase
MLHTPLTDGIVRLDPISEAHRDALRAACAEDQAIWEIYSSNWGPDGFDAQFDGLLGNPGRLGFAIIDGAAVAGMTAYLNIEPGRGALEIGNSYIAPRLRGTGFNRRIKQLMIDHAIACGYRRIEFRIDARNARSQAAVLKLGATREGVMRADRITWTGHVRDTVLLSILADEWKASA